VATVCVTVGGPSPRAQRVSLNAATGRAEQVTDTDPIPGMVISLPLRRWRAFVPHRSPSSARCSFRYRRVRDRRRTPAGGARVVPAGRAPAGGFEGPLCIREDAVPWEQPAHSSTAMTSGPIRSNDQSYAEPGAGRPRADGAVVAEAGAECDRVASCDARCAGCPGSFGPPGARRLPQIARQPLNVSCLGSAGLCACNCYRHK
jgi:hypothetical protein